MRKAIAALPLAVALLGAGCLAVWSGVPSSDGTATSHHTSTVASPEVPSQDPYFAFTNERSEPVRVTVYVVDGEVESYTYVRPNGSTVTSAPWRDPGSRPDNYTDVRPANDVFWSKTYVVDPESSLLVRFRNMPDEATLMSFEVHETTPEGVVVEHGSTHTSEQCLISVEESPVGSRSMGGCRYDYEDHVYANATTTETVTLNGTTGR